MFSDIKKFADEGFFKENQTGKLYCKSGVYDIKIYTYCEIDANKDIAYKLEKYKNGQNDSLLSFFEERAKNKNDIEITAEDKLIMLSTCHGHGTGDRAVLACKIEKSSSSAVINDEVNSKLEKEIVEEDTTNTYNIPQSITTTNTQEQTAFSKLSYKFKRLLNNPKKLVLYIMIFFTVILYIVLIIRKIKQRKEPKGNDIYNSDIEKQNLENIRYMMENEKETDTNIKYDKKAQSESHSKGKHESCKKYKTRRYKGKH